MGLFVHEDSYYNSNVRQVGLNRYKQLLSQHVASWLKLNLFTVLGGIPLAVGIGYAILSSSILVLVSWFKILLYMTEELRLVSKFLFHTGS